MRHRTSRDADSPSTRAALAALPLILRLDDVVALTRRGKSTILREIGADTFRPRPFDSHPYRWYRADWEEHFARRPRPKGSVAWTLKPARRSAGRSSPQHRSA